MMGRWVAAFLAGWLGFGPLGMALAKYIGSPVWGWTIGYFTGVAAMYLDRRLFGRWPAK